MTKKRLSSKSLSIIYYFNYSNLVLGKCQTPVREIKGVGEKTEQRLIMHYGSVARIASASVQDLETLVGKELAGRIHDTLTEGKI